MSETAEVLLASTQETERVLLANNVVRAVLTVCHQVATHELIAGKTRDDRRHRCLRYSREKGMGADDLRRSRWEAIPVALTEFVVLATST